MCQYELSNCDLIRKITPFYIVIPHKIVYNIGDICKHKKKR